MNDDLQQRISSLIERLCDGDKNKYGFTRSCIQIIELEKYYKLAQGEYGKKDSK